MDLLGIFNFPWTYCIGCIILIYVIKMFVYANFTMTHHLFKVFVVGIAQLGMTLSMPWCQELLAQVPMGVYTVFLLTISVFWKVIGRQIKFSIFFHCLKATRFTAVAVWLELLRTHTSAKGKYLYIHCLHRCTSQPILFWQPTVAKEAKARKAAKAMILERRTNLHLVPAYTSSSSFQHARAAFWPLREGSAPHGWFFSDFKSFQLSSWNGFETY